MQCVCDNFVPVMILFVRRNCATHLRRWTCDCFICTQKVRDTLQGLPDESPLDGSLKNWWNMFDAFSVSRINNDAAEMPAISDEEFGKVGGGGTVLVVLNL
jgi:hypothetical protein